MSEELSRLRVIEGTTHVVGVSVVKEEVRLGRADANDEKAQGYAQRGARVMLDSLLARGVEIPTELLAEEDFSSEIIPRIARNDAIRPTADQIDQQIDLVLAEEAQDEAAHTR